MVGLLDYLFGGGDTQPQPQPAQPPGLLAPQYDGWARLGNALSQGAATHSMAGLLGGALDPMGAYRLSQAAQQNELGQYDLNYYRQRNQPQMQQPQPQAQPQMQPQAQPVQAGSFNDMDPSGVEKLLPPGLTGKITPYNPAFNDMDPSGMRGVSLPPPFPTGAAPRAPALSIAPTTDGNGFMMTPAMALQQALQMSAAPRLAGNAMASQKLAETMLTNGLGVRADGSIGRLPGANEADSQKSAATASGSAPYDILKALAGQAGRAVQIEPGASVATGFQNMPPDVAAAFHRVIGGAGGAGSAPPQRMAGGPSPGPGQNAVGFPTQPGYENGRMQNPLTLQGATMQKTVLPEQFKAAADHYQAAQGMMGQLDMIDRNLDDLNTAGWSSTGAGANTKMGLFKMLNGISQTVGGQAVFDPSKIATWEDFNKESTRMGFELAKTLGSREAMQIVQQAVGSVPNAENTYLGGKLVSSSLRQAAIRQSDYYEFLNQFAMSHGGNTMGADVAFNKSHPIGGYVKTAIANAQQGKQTVGPAAASSPAAPAVGTVQGGYRFNGGNPADQNSWQKVQ